MALNFGEAWPIFNNLLKAGRLRDGCWRLCPYVGPNLVFDALRAIFYGFKSRRDHST